ncbi:translation initiation factor IF-2-like isoform X2 [Mustela putorius furo]|nr:translation initiation factor IF-2-like isoform X2 [Mustela putorius furo]XP_044940267.1 translation initiation factor IF-2-like isoform X2 [Mustela putorius furo]
MSERRSSLHDSRSVSPSSCSCPRKATSQKDGAVPEGSGSVLPGTPGRPSSAGSGRRLPESRPVQSCVGPRDFPTFRKTRQKMAANPRGRRYSELTVQRLDHTGRQGRSVGPGGTGTYAGTRPRWTRSSPSAASPPAPLPGSPDSIHGRWGEAPHAGKCGQAESFLQWPPTAWERGRPASPVVSNTHSSPKTGPKTPGLLGAATAPGQEVPRVDPAGAGGRVAGGPGVTLDTQWVGPAAG